MAEKFSLKDELFNPKKVKLIASEIKGVYVPFLQVAFEDEVLGLFPTLELKERITHITTMFAKYLPSEYVEATGILLQALPTPLDASKTDDDFGDFIYAPYGEFVATYGCTQEHLAFSLLALREITKRFSVEYAVRDFINTYPDETLAMLEKCAKSKNYHERRLASEGLRPKLPWAKKLNIDYTEPLRHLDLLYSDATRYVTRSVANHLNDIAKIDAPLVINTLKRWKKQNRQNAKEMAFIVTHSLRTLVKNGNEEALALLGYEKNPSITVESVTLKSNTVQVGQTLEFEVVLVAQDDAMLMVDYVMHFRTKAGSLSPKVHKLKKLTLQKGKAITLKKKHPFKANMSTRTLYEGKHVLEVQINGTIVYNTSFDLRV